MCPVKNDALKAKIVLSWEPDGLAPSVLNQLAGKSRHQIIRTLSEMRKRRRSRQIPFIQQMEAAECGAAALTMLLTYHGKRVQLCDVRSMMGGGRNGVNASLLLNAARHFKLEGGGYPVRVDQLGQIPRGSILHLKAKHFVVFDRVNEKDVYIIDPALGRRRITFDEFRDVYSGVALVLKPSSDFQTGGMRRHRVWSYFKRITTESPLSFGKVLALSGVLQLAALGLPLCTKILIDRVVPQHDYSVFRLISVAAVGLLLFQYSISYLRGRLLNTLRVGVNESITVKFLEHLLSLPYAFFQQRAAGDLMRRMESNSTIREILTSNTITALLDGVLVILSLAALFLINLPVALLALLLGLGQTPIYFFTRGRMQELLTRKLMAEAESHNYQVQMLSGIEMLKASGSEQRATEKWAKLFRSVTDVDLEYNNLQTKIDSASGLMQTGATIIILIVSVKLVLAGDLSLGSMFAVNSIAAGFISPLSSLMITASRIQLLNGHIERIDDVLETEPEQNTDRVTRAHRLAGEIKLENVWFRYSSTGNDVIKGISVEILPGQTAAVVGKSGSGKSTLARLLTGLYKPCAGSVYYDGVDLNMMDVRSVRRQIGVVTQQDNLMNTTIRENIASGDTSVSLDQISTAARLAHIHEEIMDMPLGYDTPLVDAGASLSGGQRQRIALARALVHEPSIILLDEATSHLDAITERLIFEGLGKIMATKIIIAHRLSTIKNADLILVLNNGEIEKSGNHDDLMSTGGIYADMFSAQTGSVGFRTAMQ